MERGSQFGSQRKTFFSGKTSSINQSKTSFINMVDCIKYFISRKNQMIGFNLINGLRKSLNCSFCVCMSFSWLWWVFNYTGSINKYHIRRKNHVVCDFNEISRNQLPRSNNTLLRNSLNIFPNNHYFFLNAILFNHFSFI